MNSRTRVCSTSRLLQCAGCLGTRMYYVRRGSHQKPPPQRKNEVFWLFWQSATFASLHPVLRTVNSPRVPWRGRRLELPFRFTPTQLCSSTVEAMIVLPKLKLVFMAMVAFPFARASPEVELNDTRVLAGTGSTSESAGQSRDLKMTMMMVMMSVKPSPATKPVMPPTMKPTSPTKSPTKSPTNSPTIARVCGIQPCTCTEKFVCGGSQAVCGPPGNPGDCACSIDTEGRRICFNHGSCTGTCSASSDCPSGRYCVPGTCCGRNVCLCPCGVC
jgi:hypothetical protein